MELYIAYTLIANNGVVEIRFFINLTPFVPLSILGEGEKKKVGLRPQSPDLLEGSCIPCPLALTGVS